MSSSRLRLEPIRFVYPQMLVLLALDPLHPTRGTVDGSSMLTSSPIEFSSPPPSHSSGLAGSVFLTVFGAIFAAAGLSVLAFILPEAVETGANEGIVVAGLLGFVFTGVGFGIVWLGVHSRRLGNERNELMQRHPNEPWMWNREWASREIKGSNAASMIFLWAFAAVWNGISWPLVPKMIEEVSRGNRGALIGLVFPAVGIAVFAAAVHAALRARRFGCSIFVLDTLPGVIGGELVGTVCASVTFPANEGFHVRLVCVNRITTGSGKNRSTNEHVLHEQKQEIAPRGIRHGFRGSEIPLKFLIPFESRGSHDEDLRNTINWRVEVEGSFKGVDYSTQFEIPVFKTAASSDEVSESDLEPEILDRALAGDGALAGSKVQVTPMPGDGVVLYFPAARNKGIASGLTVFAAIWGAVTWFLATTPDVPIMLAGIFGFFEVLIVSGAFAMWFSSTRVRAGRSGLIVKGGPFGVGREMNVPANEIDGIEIEVGMQQGSRVFYRLRAYHGRTSIECGSGLPEKTEAAALASLLNRALGIDPNRRRRQPGHRADSD